MTTSVKSKKGRGSKDTGEGRTGSKATTGGATEKKGGTRVNTIIYVRGTAKKKVSGKAGTKTAKKTPKKAAAARPRRDRVRDGK